jgi:DNA-binding response OmpR family regulator
MTHRILIIDDDASIRETMRLALEAAGYQVEVAADGASGLALFGTGAGWDLVLLDHRMVGMEGLEVLARIHACDPAARVIMVTAFASVELAVDAMKGGAADFLRKPFTPEVLRGAVRAVLSQPRRHTPGPAGVSSRAAPQIQFRTLNGYRYSPLELPEEAQETEALRIRRAFMVEAPSGERRRCAVDATTSVRGAIRELLSRECPPADPVWDYVCKTALSGYLWEHSVFPPDNLLVFGLTREQVRAVRAMSGLRPGSQR